MFFTLMVAVIPVAAAMAVWAWAAAAGEWFHYTVAAVAP